MSQDNKSPSARISFTQAAMYWLKLGCISFGGPAGQISMMHHELVEKNRWISERRFLHALNFTMMLPGPEAQQLATYMGWLMHGVRGGLVAGVLFVLPSLLLLMLLTWLYLAFGDSRWLQAVLYGIKPAVTAIVLFAAWRIGKKTLRNPCLLGIALLAFVAIFVLDIAFPWIVLAAALSAYVLSLFRPQDFTVQTDTDGADTKQADTSAIIGDHTPLPDHARGGWKTLIWALGIGLCCWLVGFLGLVLWQGWDHTLSQLALFFSKAALVTFGGAYAVLPYVYQGGVEQYQWLSAAQMIDGLALGETTPGPLIMIVTFIGFVAGWSQSLVAGSAETLLLPAIAGGLVATFFTFLPSFIFIFAGAPMIESTRQNLHLNAPLTGITAAVVGVILNLAVFFAWHIFWPEGFAAGVDLWSVLICLLAVVALLYWRWGIIPIILSSALMGVLIQQLVVFI